MWCQKIIDLPWRPLMVGKWCKSWILINKSFSWTMCSLRPRASEPNWMRLARLRCPGSRWSIHLRNHWAPKAKYEIKSDEYVFSQHYISSSHDVTTATRVHSETIANITTSALIWSLFYYERDNSKHPTYLKMLKKLIHGALPSQTTAWLLIF